MRATLDIDDLLARKLKQRATKEGRSFEEIVNQTLAHGLMPQEPFRQTTYSLGGVQEGIDLAKALPLAVMLDDDERARSLRRNASRRMRL